jgi:LysR family glycine cleavage system transcriptional activator
MLKTLPYNALRTLEAVVRLQGFGRAADELNVTQSAVSQHIKQLEDWLGHQLLIRQSPHTHATEQGERLARAIRDGFGPISSICDELRDTRNARKHRVLVAAPPGFAFVWLLPRLLDFDNTYPDIPISLSTDPKSQHPATSEADVIISYATGGFPNMHAEALMAEMMAPVCAPELAAQLTAISDLANHVILEDMAETPEHEPNWSFWAKEVGVTLPPFPRHRKFGQANLVIQAAISGSGIAMGRGPLVEDAIAQGTLVHPFPDFARSQFSYWFVCQHAAMKSKPVQAFHGWIKSKTARTSSI